MSSVCARTWAVSAHPLKARTTQKQSSHFVLQLPWLSQATGWELQESCLDCTCRITGSDLGVGWQRFVEAILYFLCCPIAMAPCWEDPCGGSWIPAGKAAEPLWGFPAACGSSAGCPEPGILQPQAIHQHIAPCVITMTFTTFTHLCHVFIITTVILELQSRSILCRSGMPGSVMNWLHPFLPKKIKGCSHIGNVNAVNP